MEKIKQILSEHYGKNITWMEADYDGYYFIKFEDDTLSSEWMGDILEIIERYLNK